MLNSYYIEKLLGLEGVEVKNIQEKEEYYEISTEQPRKVCICPFCGEKTSKIHDYRYQRIKDSRRSKRKSYLFYVNADTYAPVGNVSQNRIAL